MKKKPSRQIRLRRGDTVRLRRPLIGFPTGGYFKVERMNFPFLELSVGSIIVGVSEAAKGHFVVANGEKPDWEREEVAFQEHMCRFLRKTGQGCPECEEQLRKKREAVGERGVH